MVLNEVPSPQDCARANSLHPPPTPHFSANTIRKSVTLIALPHSLISVKSSMNASRLFRINDLK